MINNTAMVKKSLETIRECARYDVQLATEQGENVNNQHWINNRVEEIWSYLDSLNLLNEHIEKDTVEVSLRGEIRYQLEHKV